MKPHTNLNLILFVLGVQRFIKGMTKYQKHFITHDQLVEEYMDEDDRDFYTDSFFSENLADQSHRSTSSCPVLLEDDSFCVEFSYRGAPPLSISTISPEHEMYSNVPKV